MAKIRDTKQYFITEAKRMYDAAIGTRRQKEQNNDRK